jgi:hypothetical protein
MASEEMVVESYECVQRRSGSLPCVCVMVHAEFKGCVDGWSSARTPLVWMCRCSWLLIVEDEKDTAAVILRPCLVSQIHLKFYYAKRRFPITSKCRQMYGVLNVDEIIN